MGRGGRGTDLHLTKKVAGAGRQRRKKGEKGAAEKGAGFARGGGSI